MIMGQALERKYKATGDQALLRRSERRDAAHRRARLPPRRGRLATLLQEKGLADHPLFAASQGCAASRRWPATPKASTSPTT
jgi:hypothetical protein